MINDIPLCFKDRNEDYLTIGSLQEFCKTNNLRTNLDKVELIKSIIEFGKVSEKNSQKVASWIDLTLKEGIKKLILKKIEGSRKYKNKTKEEWKELINEVFNIEVSNNIIYTEHTNKLRLCGYDFSVKNNNVEKISLNFTILINEFKKKNMPLATIIYPIFVDVDIRNGYIIGRSKPKSSIWKFETVERDGVTIKEETDLVNCDKLIGEAINETIEKLQLGIEDSMAALHRFKVVLHDMVYECTKTPVEIQAKLEEEKSLRKQFVKNFLERQGIDLLKGDNYKDALEDLNVFMEKYISINHEDKSIFTRDRYAYPIQISATDDDSSSVEETSLEDKPLQCTPIFFDNKKVIQKQKKCDNIVMVFQREVKTYFTNNTFRVIIQVKRGEMHIDLRKYVLEEDIENVLSRVIRSN